MEFKLILKKLKKSLSIEEQKHFDAWFLESRRHRKYFSKVQKHHLNQDVNVNLKKGWRNVHSRISSKSKKIFYQRCATAAVFLLLVGTVLFIEIKSDQATTIVNKPQVSETLGTVSNGVVLTLSDGSEIQLQNGQKYENAQVSNAGDGLVYKKDSNDNAKTRLYNTLKIPKGGEYFVILSDGTRVWLNADSEFRYPVSFESGTSREVMLINGEAYFEVSPSRDHGGSNFIVQSKGQQVEVLGTQFNLRAYKDENQVLTTLVEGKITVENKAEKVVENLTPGRQSKLHLDSRELSIANVNVFDEVSWRRGFFSFNDKSLSEISKVLSRWYDVEFMFSDKEIEKLRFSGVFRREQELKEILNIFSQTNTIQFTITDKTVIMD